MELLLVTFLQVEKAVMLWFVPMFTVELSEASRTAAKIVTAHRIARSGKILFFEINILLHCTIHIRRTVATGPVTCFITNYYTHRYEVDCCALQNILHQTYLVLFRHASHRSIPLLA